jgi:hypothetical protein
MRQKFWRNYNACFCYEFTFFLSATTTASKPSLRPTEPPIQWVPGTLSLGIKRLGREANHSPSSSAEVKEWVEPCLRSPIRLHGVVLIWSTGTTLLYLTLSTTAQKYTTGSTKLHVSIFIPNFSVIFIYKCSVEIWNVFCYCYVTWSNNVDWTHMAQDRGQ